MKRLLANVISHIGFGEVAGVIGLASLCVGASMIYTPLPYLIVGLTLITLCVLAARKGV